VKKEARAPLLLGEELGAGDVGAGLSAIGGPFPVEVDTGGRSRIG